MIVLYCTCNAVNVYVCTMYVCVWYSSLDVESSSARGGSGRSARKSSSRHRAPQHASMAISDHVDQGDGRYEEVQHADGKVRVARHDHCYIDILVFTCTYLV